MTISPTDLAVAFAAGFVSFVSPCVWPLIPGYLSFISGVPGAELPAHRRRVVVAAIGFVAGFSLLFALAGAGAGVLGAQFLDHRRGLELVGGAVVIAMGVVMLMPTASLAARARKLPAPAQPHGPLGQPSPARPSASAGRHASARSWRPSSRSPAAMAELRTVRCCCSSTASGWASPSWRPASGCRQ